MNITEKEIFDFFNDNGLAIGIPVSMRGYQKKSFMQLIRIRLNLNDSNLPMLFYEVPLNETHLKYPDFYLTNGDYTIRIEIKNSCNEQSIAKEANSLFDFDGNEYWFILMGDQNIDKILHYTNNLDSRIMFMHFDENLIKNMVQKSF